VPVRYVPFLLPVSDVGLCSFTTKCWMSMADLTRRGGGFRKAIVELPTNTEFCLGRRIMGDGRADKGSVMALTLYFEKDILCCK
jgi:hypothetical protein